MYYIVDFKPIIIENIDYEVLASIEEKIINKVSITNDEAEYFLDNICYIARNKINEKMDNYDYKCDMFKVMFYHYFANLNCEFIPCMTQNVITNDIVGHSFSILKIMVENEEKLFLIDPSYIQFFGKDRCKYENYIFDINNKNNILLTPDPGYFIKDEGKVIIDNLLSHGFIELDENVAKIYGDSFLNTKRGIIFSNPINISGKVYINSFLKGNEQIQKNEDTLKDLGLHLELFKDKIEARKR